MAIFRRTPKKEEKDKEKKGKEEKPKKEAKKKRKVSEKPALALKKPHITEKAAVLAGENQYVFEVFTSATKPEIKKAIEELYGVKVLKVRIIKIPKKARRLGRTTGYRKGYKKAIVKIKAGQKIEIIPR